MVYLHHSKIEFVKLLRLSSRVGLFAKKMLELVLLNEKKHGCHDIPRDGRSRVTLNMIRILPNILGCQDNFRVWECNILKFHVLRVAILT